MLRVVGREGGGGRPGEFGASYTTKIPKNDIVRMGDKVYGRLDRTRRLTICNTDARMYALSLNWPLAQACAAAISSDQRGFVSGRSILTSVRLCEVAMSEAAITSVDATGVFLDISHVFPIIEALGVGQGAGSSAIHPCGTLLV